MEKPISMIIDETKQALISVINGCQLHPSIIEMIIKEVYLEVNSLNMNVASKEKEAYLQEEKESTEK